MGEPGGNEGGNGHEGEECHHEWYEVPMPPQGHRGFGSGSSSRGGGLGSGAQKKKFKCRKCPAVVERSYRPGWDEEPDYYEEDED